MVMQYWMYYSSGLIAADAYTIDLSNVEQNFKTNPEIW